MKKILIILLAIISQVYGQSDNVVTVGTSGGGVVSQAGISLKNSGILSDADLGMYSTTFGTDQTSAVQAILNTASASNPLYLIWDAKISCTGLKVKSYTTIVALQGCGAILRDSSNSWLLSNYNFTGNSNALVDSFITIDGGIWNGDGFRSGVGKQLNASSSKGMTTGMLWSGVKNLVLENFTYRNSRTWCFLFLTTENLLIDNVNIDNPDNQINQDGFNFLGRATNVNIRNCSIRCGDDRLTFCPNSTGGAAGSEHHELYLGVDGDQTNINVSNIYFYGGGKGIAIYNAGGNIIKDVSFENIYGTSETVWLEICNADFLVGWTLTTGSKVPTNISFKNIDIDVPTVYTYGGAPLTFPLATISCSAENLTFSNIKRTDYTLSNESIGIFVPSGHSTPIVIKNLILDGLRSFNTAPAQNVDQLYVLGTGATVTVNNLFINNCNVDLGSTTIAKSLISIRSGATITNLSTANNNINNLKYFLNNAGTITNARVNGTTHTGQGGTDPTILTSGTLTTLWMTNWIGVLSTSGTIGTSKGDAFL